MLQLCRGSAEIDCPVIGTCRNVGSNLGSHVRHDSYRQSVTEICLGKTELSQGLVWAAITLAPAVITYTTVHLMCSRPNQ